MNKQNIALGGGVIALVLSIVALVGNQPATSIKGEKGDKGETGIIEELGSRGSRFPGDYCIGSGFRFVCRGATALEYRRGTDTASTTAAASSDSFQNVSGHDIWVRYSLIFEGQASSTVFHEVGTSTAAMTGVESSRLATKSILSTLEIATGTPSFAFSNWFGTGTTSQYQNAISAATPGEATTTAVHKIKNFFLSKANGLTDIGSLNSQGWVRVKHGEHVVGVFYGLNRNCIQIVGAQNVNCENATSSARDWDAYGMLEYMYVASSSDSK